MSQTTATLVKATINGKSVEVPEGTTILEAAAKVHLKIPTLCKHPDLPPTAACGICIVKVAGMGKMPRACCTPVEDGMVITTHDPEVVELRRNVVKMILSKHPNECLTCGRNGHCELQTLASDFGIRQQRLPSLVKDLPIDNSTGTIVLEPRKCILCGRCLSVCQDLQNVWALSFLERGLETRVAPAGDITLAESPCIGCGQCSAHCPTGAIFEFDEIEKVWGMLRDKTYHCVVQIAPAVRVAIGEAFGYPPGTNLTNKLYTALRYMGFDTVFDTNFGADVTIMEEGTEFVQRFIHHKGELPLITSCCPAWVDFMEKYHSDMIDNFSTCKSPHAIVGTLAKTYFAKKAKLDPRKMRVVSIMPCTAKKYEIMRSQDMFASGFQDVDVSLTTRELARMIKQAGIDFANLPDSDADSILGEYTGAGTIFGVTGGVAEAAVRGAHYLITNEHLEDMEFEPIRGLEGVKEATVTIGKNEIRIAVAHGMGNIETVLDRVRAARESGDEPPYHMIEVMACPGGCIGGGGQPYGITDELRYQRAMGLYGDDRNRKKRRSYENEAVQQLYKDFLGKPMSETSHKLLHTRYKGKPTYQR